VLFFSRVLLSLLLGLLLFPHDPKHLTLLRAIPHFVFVSSVCAFYSIVLFYYYYLVCEAIGTAANPGLLCQPRVMVKMIVEKQMVCSLAGETEVVGENLPQLHFCPSQNPT
jgi:hypothetical protein